MELREEVNIMNNEENKKNIDEQTSDVETTTKVETSKQKKPNFTKKRSFKYGSMATAFTAIVVAIVILLNVGVTVLNQKYPMTIDMTKSNDYGISQESIDYVKNVTAPIKITWFATKSELDSNIMQVHKIVSEFPKYNSNISIEYIDFDKNPTSVAAYPNENISRGDIVVSTEVNGEKKYKYIGSSDFYIRQTDSSTYQQQIVGTQIEQQIDNAIDYVTSDKLPKVVFTTGHNETSSTDLQGLYKSSNYQVSAEAVSSKDIDSDIDTLVIMAPQADFTNDEITRIDKWVKNDGNYGKNIFVFLDPRLEELKNLEGYLEEWGVKAETGVIYDYTNNFNNSPFNTAASTVNKDVVGDQVSTDIKTAVTSARPLTLLFDNKGNRTTTKVIETGDSSKVMKDITASIADSDPAGPFTVMTKTTMGDTNNSSNMIVSGSYEMTIADQINASNKSNSKVLLGIADNLMAKKPSLTIASKYSDTSTLSLSIQERYVLLVIFVIALPVILIVLGIVTWLRRRHL